MKNYEVRLTLAVLAAASVMVVSGCTSSPGSTESGSTGGTAIFPNISDPTSLTPVLSSSSTDLYAGCLMFEGLVKAKADYTYEGVLATDWTVSDDGLEYDFTLREGVEWHDGEPFTSADVLWTFENVTSTVGVKTVRPLEGAVFEAPSEYEFTIALAQPFAPLLGLLTCESAILPMHIYGDGQDIATHPRNFEDPIGTGPFVFDSYSGGVGLTVVRNDDYWDEGKPYLDRVVVQTMTSPDAVINALEAGDVDFIPALSLDRTAYVRLSQDPRFQDPGVVGVPSNNLVLINNSRPELSDPSVRQALMRATDRETIREVAAEGLGGLGTSAIDPGIPWAYNSDVDLMEMYPYDPEAAADELDSAGLEPDADGVRLRLTMPYDSGNASFANAAQIIADGWGQAGIELTLEPMDFTAYVQKVHVEGDYDVALDSYTTNGDPALGIQRLYISDAIGNRPFQNASKYSNPEVDALFAEGASLPTEEARAVPYFKVQEILAEDVPVLVLNSVPTLAIADADLEGLDIERDGPSSWADVRYADGD